MSAKAKNAHVKVEIAPRLAPTSALIESYIDALPAALRLYPDLFANGLTQALADAGLLAVPQVSS